MGQAWRSEQQQQQQRTVTSPAPTTPRARSSMAAVPLESAVVSEDSQTNQGEREIEKYRRDIQEILRLTTDARVHIAKTKVDRAWLYTDFVLSPDSTQEMNKKRITEFIETQRNREIYAVYEADHYIPVQYPGFPTEHHEWRPTLIVRVYATLTVYTPCRYWTSRVTAMIQLVLLLFFASVALYTIKMRWLR
jgi:hypothetical protein